ncbi:ribonuclease III [Microthyrium microscopicum]|uniref:Ribonuclease III n=1 Tax=Microthyrium microscopicum TaxID=703497 RepID=A0A6A6U9Z2_9PEZI|nr:ribonuclease III [Microthyrium microscopicum]
MTSLDQKIEECESIIDYVFADRKLCAEALNTYVSCHTIDGSEQFIPRNNRLALLGDKAMDDLFAFEWYSTGMSTGTYTLNRDRILSNHNHDRVGRRFKLEHCVNLSPGTTSVSTNTMATTIEAILGAVRIDGGEIALAKVSRRLGIMFEAVTYFHLHDSMNTTI